MKTEKIKVSAWGLLRKLCVTKHELVDIDLEGDVVVLTVAKHGQEGARDFGSYQAHQPNYDGFKQLGKLNDFIFQSLAHMGDASHKMSWAITVLENEDVPNDLINEMKSVISQMNDLKEKLRAIKEVGIGRHRG